MPTYEVELSDGRIVELEGEREPTESDVMSALGQQQPSAGPQPEPAWKSIAGSIAGEFVKGSLPSISPEKILAAPTELPQKILEPVQETASRIASDFLNRTGIDPSAMPGRNIANIPFSTKIPGTDISPLGLLFGKEAQQGVEQRASDILSGFTEPGSALSGAAALPVSPLAKPAQAYFGASAAAQLPQSAQEIAEARTPREVGSALLGAAANVAIAKGLGEQFLKEGAPDAIQERSTEKVPVEEPPGDRQAVEQGIRVGETPSVPQEGQTQVQAQVTPAIQTPEGKVVEGEDHVSAYEKAKATGTPDTSGSKEGFTDPEGKFISREKAAQETGLPTTTEEGKLHSSDLPNEPEQLKLQGMGGAVPPEFEQPGSYVSNMFAAIDRDRAEMGKPPMEPGRKRTWDEDNQTALARMNRDPGWIPNLIDQVLEKPRPLLSWENAGLVWQRQAWTAEYNNALKRIAQSFDDNRTDSLAEAKLDAARFEDNLERLDRAVGRGGTGSEAGRTLQAQKMGSGDDFTLVEMRLQRRAAKGGERLTPAEDAEIARTFQEHQRTIEKLRQHLADRDHKLAESESRRAFLELQKAPKASDYVIRLAEKWVSDLDKRADAARVRIRERMSRMSAGVDPTLLIDLAEVGAAHIGHIGLDFAKWSVKMVEDLGEFVRPHLREVWEKSQKSIEGLPAPSEVKKTLHRGVQTPADVLSKVAENLKDRKLSQITALVQKLARMYVQQGVKTREDLIQRVHSDLVKIDPNITGRETMDAISGYGQFKRLTKDQVSVELRDLKGQMQQVAKLEDMAAKKAPVKTGIERRIPSDEERRLITLVNKSKLLGGYEITDPDTQLKSALQTWKTNARNRMVDLQRKIKEGDYSRPQRSELVLDQEALNMQAELKRIKKRWNDGLRRLEAYQRSWWQRAGNSFVKWERAFKLSSPVVFGKLASAALTRAVTTVGEETVGGALSKVPGISKVAEQAPREGGINVTAIAKGMTEAITKGMKEAWDTLTKGGGDIDFVYGEKIMDKDWANVLGQMHGALKAPVKLGEFRLSLEKRIAHAVKNGVDPTDPFVQTRLATESLNDAYRSIFMQRGFSSDMFNQMVSQMEKSKKYPVAGEVTARVARFLFPVVRVPLNIVGETMTGAHGLATASTRTMFHAINGTLDKLDPKTADSIMRQFKKGSIGLGLIAIGYMNPDMAGGYDWREKRKKGAVKTGGFQIAGTDIPRWATHAPWFELMQIGATIRHVRDQHLSGGGTKGVGEGVWAAALGLADETPFYGEMMRAARASMSPTQRDAFFGEVAKSTAVPQAVIKAAEVSDTDKYGQPIKRKPRTILEHVKTGVPGLREDVPVKR